MHIIFSENAAKFTKGLWYLHKILERFGGFLRNNSIGDFPEKVSDRGAAERIKGFVTQENKIPTLGYIVSRIPIMEIMENGNPEKIKKNTI